jgi:hypothetical protein
MKQFPGRVANVWMNYVESDTERVAPIGKRLFRKIAGSFTPNGSGESKNSNTVLSVSREEGWISTKKLAQDGIWDAAFGLMGNKPLGFSFRGSPFGEDTFGYIAPIYSMFKYRDVFTGMIFYQPLDRHMIENSIPGYFDPDFQRVLLERAKLLGDKYVENVRRIIASAEKMGNSTSKTNTHTFKLVFMPRE